MLVICYFSGCPIFRVSAYEWHYAYLWLFFFYCCGDHRDLHVLTHSFPTRRSSDLPDHLGRAGQQQRVAAREVDEKKPGARIDRQIAEGVEERDRKSTRLNSSH